MEEPQKGKYFRCCVRGRSLPLAARSIVAIVCVVLVVGVLASGEKAWADANEEDQRFSKLDLATKNDGPNAPTGDLAKRIAVLKNDIELRDLEEAESQIAKIKEIAPDFDAKPYLSLINDIKKESRRHLDEARLLANRGQMEKAMAEFQNAAEEWPGNPDYADTAKSLFANATASAVQNAAPSSNAPNPSLEPEKAVAIKSPAMKAEDGAELRKLLPMLKSTSQEVRARAAQMIRDRGLYDPSPRESWQKLLDSFPLHNGDSQNEVVEQLHKWGVATTAAKVSGKSCIIHYRLDDTWVLACAYSDGGLSDFWFMEAPRMIDVSPPSNYTGFWRLYRIDGTSLGLLYYSKGKYLGTPQDNPMLKEHVMHDGTEPTGN